MPEPDVFKFQTYGGRLWLNGPFITALDKTTWRKICRTLAVCTIENEQEANRLDQYFTLVIDRAKEDEKLAKGMLAAKYVDPESVFGRKSEVIKNNRLLTQNYSRAQRGVKKLEAMQEILRKVVLADG